MPLISSSIAKEASSRTVAIAVAAAYSYCSSCVTISSGAISDF
jgi:hypothetical protein